MATAAALSEFNAAKAQMEATINQLRESNGIYVAQINTLNEKYNSAVAAGSLTSAELKKVKGLLEQVTTELATRNLAINKLETDLLNAQHQKNVQDMGTTAANTELVRLQERYQALQADNTRLLNELASSRMQSQQLQVQPRNTTQMPQYMQIPMQREIQYPTSVLPQSSSSQFSRPESVATNEYNL